MILFPQEPMLPKSLRRVVLVGLVLLAAFLPLAQAEAAAPSSLGGVRLRFYRDPRSGFTLRYPDTWSLRPVESSAGDSVTTLSNHPLEDAVAAGAIGASPDWVKVEVGTLAHGKPSRQELQEWVSPAPWMRAFQTGESRWVLANGLMAVQQVYQLEGLTVWTTFIARGASVYFLTITSRDPDLSPDALALLDSFIPGGATYRAQAAVTERLYPQDGAQASEGAAPLAPAGWRLPVDGCHTLTAGPLEGYHRNAAAEAMDLSMVQGTTVRAVEAGTVTFADWSSVGYGWAVEVQHASGLRSWYAHLSKILATRGEVSRGQEIGLSGNTGNSTGPHLHLHARNGSAPVCLRDLPGVWWNRTFPPGSAYVDSGCVCYPPSAAVPEPCDEGARPLSCAYSSDSTPPDGAITAPEDGTLASAATIRLQGWASDGRSGLDRAHFIVLLPDGWKQVGPDFRTSPFSYEWSLCAAQVPAGSLTIGLDIWDRNGNVAYTPGGVRRITLSPDCTRYCAPGADQVAIYLHEQYAGTCAVRGVGQYSDAATMGLPNDSLSSLQVGSKVLATLCRDVGLGGGCQTYAADTPFVGGALNDRYSSLKVELDSAPPTGSLRIQDGAAVIIGFGATVTLSASDNHGPPEMRMHDEATPFGPWEPFAASKHWGFLPREGEHLVAVQFRDAAGNLSEVYTQTIICQVSDRVFVPLVQKGW